MDNEDNKKTKIKVKRICEHCLFHYMIDLEDEEQCFEKGGCKHFSPIGLRIINVEVIIED